MTLPYGALPIADARKRGLKPADMVIVSLVGPLDCGNPVVIAGSKEYDWWWTRGLQICVFARSGTPWRRTLAGISAHRPAKLWLWDVERAEGADVYYLPTIASLRAAKSVSEWVWQLDFLPWLKFQNIEFAKYDQKDI